MCIIRIFRFKVTQLTWGMLDQVSLLLYIGEWLIFQVQGKHIPENVVFLKPSLSWKISYFLSQYYLGKCRNTWASLTLVGTVDTYHGYWSTIKTDMITLVALATRRPVSLATWCHATRAITVHVLMTTYILIATTTRSTVLVTTTCPVAMSTTRGWSQGQG